MLSHDGPWAPELPTGRSASRDRPSAQSETLVQDVGGRVGTRLAVVPRLLPPLPHRGECRPWGDELDARRRVNELHDVDWGPATGPNKRSCAASHAGGWHVLPCLLVPRETQPAPSAHRFEHRFLVPLLGGIGGFPLPEPWINVTVAVGDVSRHVTYGPISQSILFDLPFCRLPFSVLLFRFFHSFDAKHSFFCPDVLAYCPTVGCHRSRPHLAP
jgi:hypothetical protein